MILTKDYIFKVQVDSNIIVDKDFSTDLDIHIVEYYGVLTIVDVSDHLNCII